MSFFFRKTTFSRYIGSCKLLCLFIETMQRLLISSYVLAVQHAAAVNHLRQHHHVLDLPVTSEINLTW